MDILLIFTMHVIRLQFTNIGYKQKKKKKKLPWQHSDKK